MNMDSFSGKDKFSGEGSQGEDKSKEGNLVFIVTYEFRFSP